MSDEPFMEHPTGQYTTAVDAMAAAIARLRTLPEWKQWITFCAQGDGDSAGAIRFAEVRLLSDMVELDAPVDLAQITARARVGRHAIIEAGSKHYSIANATPREAAQVLDTLFRYQFGIRPFPDEDGDYAVGAEW